MANTIQVRRGANASLPTLNAGEFGFSTDTHQVYIGNGAANHQILLYDAFNATSFLYATSDNTPENKTPSEVMGILAGQPLDMQDALLTRPKVKDYGESINAIGSIGGGAQTIDLELGNVVTGTVDTSETTFTFSNPPASGIAGSFTLILTNGGSQTVNWPAAVDWAGGTAPSLTSSGVDVITFITLDAGTIWLGFMAGLDVKSP